MIALIVTLPDDVSAAWIGRVCQAHHCHRVKHDVPFGFVIFWFRSLLCWR